MRMTKHDNYDNDDDSDDAHEDDNDDNEDDNDDANDDDKDDNEDDNDDANDKDDNVIFYFSTFQLAPPRFPQLPEHRGPATAEDGQDQNCNKIGTI